MTNQSTAIEGIYGLMAEFESPEDLIEATRGAYDQGYRMMEAYTPFPVEGLAEALGFHSNRVPRTVLLGGLVGGLSGYFMQWYSAVIAYPLNVGGRPLHSWPAFIPVTFELTVLGASLAAVVGMLAMNGLPRLTTRSSTSRASCWHRTTASSSRSRLATHDSTRQRRANSSRHSIPR